MSLRSYLTGDEALSTLQKMAKDSPHLFGDIKLSGKGRKQQVIAKEMNARIKMHNLETEKKQMQECIANLKRKSDGRVEGNKRPAKRPAQYGHLVAIFVWLNWLQWFGREYCFTYQENWVILVIQAVPFVGFGQMNEFEIDHRLWFRCVNSALIAWFAYSAFEIVGLSAPFAFCALIYSVL